MYIQVNLKPLLLMLIATLVVVASGFLVATSGATVAENTDFKAVLERYDRLMREDNEFQAVIVFQGTLSNRQDDTVWSLPAEGSGDELVTRYISEIGDDYVCFETTGGSVRYENCIPFSNIAGIRRLIDW